MNTLQSLTCAFAIGLSACSSSEKVKENIVQNNPIQEIVSPIVLQSLDRIIFEGNFEFNNCRWIPNGMHNFKFYRKNEVDFLEVTYRDGSTDKYFSFELNGKWKYVEEIRGKSIVLIPSEYDLKFMTDYIDSLTDFDERRALGNRLYDQVKEHKIKIEEHQTKINHYLERISQFKAHQP